MQETAPPMIAQTEPTDLEPDPVSEVPPPEMESLSDEMIASSDKTLEQVRALIREARWKEMKVAAEAALATRMTDKQKAEAEALYELADLATFYRGGIERAVAELKVGSDFEVKADFRVIIVETGEDLLVVRYSAKNRSFSFDEFPFSLAHKLASFQVPDSPAGAAAKAAYQAIAPLATDEHRVEAITWLREINEEVEGVHPKRVSEAIENLFGEDA